MKFYIDKQKEMIQAKKQKLSSESGDERNPKAKVNDSNNSNVMGGDTNVFGIECIVGSLNPS